MPTTAPTPGRRSARLAASKGSSGAAPTHYEFGGPHLGPAALVLGLPAVCYALLAACNDSGCVAGVRGLVDVRTWPGLPTPAATLAGAAVIAAWFAFQAALHLLLPGATAQGVVLADGRRLTYKLTGARGRGGGAVGEGAGRV